MIRRKGRFSVSSGDSSAVGSAIGAEDDGVNPMHHLPNLPDVMLVLAVALLVALIGHWNVDVTSQSTGTLDPSKLQAVEGDISEGEQQSNLSGNSYEEVGVVYKDTATGEMYLLTE